MKIAVCVKQVVTREWQLRVNDSRTWIRDQDASFELNEPDAYALEEALRLKEKHGGEVVVCSAGPARAAQVIREALARGADRAIHVEGDRLGAADAATVAAVLSDAMREEAFDLVLTGLQSDDQGQAQVGLAEAQCRASGRCGERLVMRHLDAVVAAGRHGQLPAAEGAGQLHQAYMEIAAGMQGDRRVLGTDLCDGVISQCVLLPVAGVAFLCWALYNSRGAYRLTGETLRVPGHPPIPLDRIEELDKDKWDKKGIAYVNYRLSGAPVVSSALASSIASGVKRARSRASVVSIFGRSLPVMR